MNLVFRQLCLGKPFRVAICILALPLVSACASFKSPDRLYSVDTEMENLRADLAQAMDVWESSSRSLTKKQQKRLRNEILTRRKYAIDVQYTQYESALTHEAAAVDAGAMAASTVLGTVAQLSPVDHTSRLLSGIGTAATTTATGYTQKVLHAHMIENIQSSMRTARHERAAVLYANMRCSVHTYPIAMALSDLEAYYRAGTFPAGLIKLSQTVTEKEKTAGAAADGQKPSSPDAQATLTAAAAEAKVKADAATVAGKKVLKQKCQVEDAGET